MGRDTCERNAAEWRATSEFGFVLTSHKARETQGDFVILFNINNALRYIEVYMFHKCILSC